jgi:hypothetical protein
VTAYVNLLSAECAALDPGVIAPENQLLYQRVSSQLEGWRSAPASRTPSWADLAAVECEILRLLPDEALPAKTKLVQDRLRDVLGDRADSPQNALGSPDSSAAITIREQLKQLVAEFHFCCAVRQEREFARARLMRWAVIGFALVLVLTALPALISAHAGDKAYFGSIVPVLIMGAFGGCVSVYLKVQGMDFQARSFSELMDLRHGLSTTFFAPLFGAISAGIMFLLFAGDIVGGELFPSIDIPKQTIRPGDYGTLIVSANAEPGPDSIKLLLWSFVAGFGERLMPNILSRLGAKVDAETART